jgi:hypothetical protein
MLVVRHIEKKRHTVPLVRYFLFVGSALLVLLFLANWYWPAASAVVTEDDQAQVTSADKAILRIRSAQKWPQKIVFDTSTPIDVPPPAGVAIIPPPAPVMAVLPASALNARAEIKPATPVRKTARRRVPRPEAVAAYPTAPAWSWNW